MREKRGNKRERLKETESEREALEKKEGGREGETERERDREKEKRTKTGEALLILMLRFHHPASIKQRFSNAGRDAPLTLIMRAHSYMVISPLPSMSYISKAHLSCSAGPAF